MSLSQNTQDSGLKLCSGQQFQVVSKNLTSLYKDSYYKWLDYFGACSSITIRCIRSAAALVMSIVIYSLLAVFANWGWRGVGVVGWSIVLVMSLGAIEGLTFREVKSVQQYRDAFSKLGLVVTQYLLFWKVQQEIGYKTSFSIPILIGLSITIAGVVIHFIAVSQLGSFFSGSIVIVEQHHLITTGIYKYIRHPCYSGLILTELGLTITASFHTTVLIFMGAVILAVGYRIWHEERLLRGFFENEYALYADKVKRLIPFIY